MYAVWVGEKCTNCTTQRKNFFLKNFFGLDGRIWQKSMLYETKIFFVKSVDFLFTLFENVLNA